MGTEKRCTAQTWQLILALFVSVAGGSVSRAGTAQDLFQFEAVGTNSIRVLVGEPRCDVTAQGEYTSVTAAGFLNSGSSGNPMLPHRVLHVAVPPEATSAPSKSRLRPWESVFSRKTVKSGRLADKGHGWSAGGGLGRGQ